MFKHARTHLLIAVLTAGLLSAAMAGGVFGAKRNQAIDLLFTSKPAPTDLVIVEIDEGSIQAVGQWPWPRKTFADLIELLGEASVIGIDVNFKEPSRLGYSDDSTFETALSRATTPVILSSDVQPGGGLIGPLSDFGTVSSHGFTNLITSSDGIVRTARYQRNENPSFSLQIASSYYFGISGESIPIIPHEPVRINFYGPGGTFPAVSAVDVLERKIPAVFFEEKIAIIGATARDLQDFHGTPFGLLSGVEIQANITSTLLGQRFFHESVWLNVIIIFMLAGIAVFLSSTVGRWGYLLSGIIFLFLGYNLIVFLSFDNFLILDLFYPNLTIVLAVSSSLTAQYFLTAKEKKFIRETFSRYLAPEVVDELLSDPSRIKLGGEKADVTILFSDIRGFTSISEGMDPEQLTGFLNDYLGRMTEVVLDHRGVIDKYIGDAVMAFWGAPLKSGDHHLKAVLSALGMMEVLKDFNRDSVKRGNPGMNIGIGINTGSVTVGNMGSEKRLDYTVLGDNVNLASRLEGLTKTYGVNIIVSQSTAGALDEETRKKSGILIRELDRVRVKGKRNSVVISEVVTRERKEKINLILERFNHGRQLYYQGRWVEAIRALEYVLTQVGDDNPSRVLVDRSRELKKLTASGKIKWEGVFDITHK